MSLTGEKDCDASFSRMPAGEVAALFEPHVLGLLRGDKRALPELCRTILDVCLFLEAKKRGRLSPMGRFRAGWVAGQITHRVSIVSGASARHFLWATWKAAVADPSGRIEPPPGSRLLRIGRLFLPGLAYRRLEERVADLREDVFDSLARDEIWRARVLPIVHFVIIAMDPLRAIIIWLSRGWRVD